MNKAQDKTELTRNQPGTKSVPNTSAQINHLYSTGTSKTLTWLTGQKLQESKRALGEPLLAILTIQAAYGLRISEVLAIQGKDISPGGAIKIKGLKRSNDRLVAVTELKAWWLSQREKPGKVFDGLSRFAVYRAYKRLNIGLNLPGRKHKAVTHAFRHLVVNDLRKIATDDKEVSKFTGHRAEKNTAIYGHLGD